MCEWGPSEQRSEVQLDHRTPEGSDIRGTRKYIVCVVGWFIMLVWLGGGRGEEGEGGGTYLVR